MTDLTILRETLDREAAPVGALGGRMQAALTRLSQGRIREKLTAGIDCRRRTGLDGEIAGLGIGLQLTNSSRHRLEYEVTAMQLALEEGHGSSTVPTRLQGTLEAGCVVSLESCMAAVPPLNAGRTVRGTFGFSLRYGLPGAARHSLAGRYSIMFKASSPREISIFRSCPI